MLFMARARARAAASAPILAMLAGVGLTGLVPSLAIAQQGPQQASAAESAAPAPAPAPATSDSAPPKPVVPATGYGWSTKPATPAGHSRGRVRAVRSSAQSSASPIGTVIPGFEMLGDGSSRLFVQLPKSATYAAKSARGSITYVLKGVHVDRRNNLNALVTVHFNTPVTRARLVPHGGDLWLVVELRANVQPAVAMDATKDGGAMLRIEFPKGDYLGGAASAEPAPAPDGQVRLVPPAASTPSPSPNAPPASSAAPAGSAYTPSSL